MEKIDYKLLNDKLDELLYGEIPITEEDIEFEDVVTTTALENTPISTSKVFWDKHCYDTKKKFSISLTKQVCLDFFNSLNPLYGEMLQELYDNGGVIFNITHNPDEYSILEEDDKIIISILENIEDIFSLTHEFMHYLNSRDEINTHVTSYFTETFSSYIELILADYLLIRFPQYKKDINKMKRNAAAALYQENFETKIIIELLKKKMDGKIIRKHELFEIIKDLDDNYGNLDLISHKLQSLLSYLISDPEEAFMYYIRYSVASVLSPYMYDRFKVKDILYLNDIIPFYRFEDVIEYLNLPFKDEESFNISTEGYKALEQSYIKLMKGLW